MANVVKISDIALSYGHDTIIEGVELSIKKGEFVFVTGPSGSGKSTFLKALYGAMSPDRGVLNIGGMNLNGISKKKLQKLRRHIGIVFQDYKLVHEWNVEKNVQLPLLIAGYSNDVLQEQTKKLLSHVKLSHKVDKHPYELSGGEQQRVALARALAHNPFLILADEPTGNLDEYSANVVWELLEGANAQLETTVIVVTHNVPSHLSVPHRQFRIQNGEVYEVY
ncbi:MAG: cell division ATP-binding protein FtsE [Campylobacterota bacterium]